MRSLGVRVAMAGALAVGALSGCYRYTPVEPAALPVGSEVRVSMSRIGAAGLPEEVPVSDARIAGTLTAWDADSLTLRVPVASRVSGPHRVAISQNILVPLTDVLQVERRDFDRNRTALAVAGAVAGAVAIVALIIEASGNAPGDGGDPPQQIRIPLGFLGVP